VCGDMDGLIGTSMTDTAIVIARNVVAASDSGDDPDDKLTVRTIALAYTLGVEAWQRNITSASFKSTRTGLS
jgi:hypothetical protein